MSVVKVVMPGGTGQVGAILERALARDGHEVVVLSRSAGAGPGSSRTVAWDARTLGPWAAELDGADVVVNLAGRSVNARYDTKTRAEIMSSRIDSTRVLGEAIARAERPPPVWLQSSTATIYAHRFDAPNDERTGILGPAEDEGERVLTGDAVRTFAGDADVLTDAHAPVDQLLTPRRRGP